MNRPSLPAGSRSLIRPSLIFRCNSRQDGLELLHNRRGRGPPALAWRLSHPARRARPWPEPHEAAGERLVHKRLDAVSERLEYIRLTGVGRPGSEFTRGTGNGDPATA